MKATVHVDEHGPLIRANGMVYRPQRSTNAPGPEMFRGRWRHCATVSALTIGERIEVDSGGIRSPYVLVSPVGVSLGPVFELWAAHGLSRDDTGAFRPSADVWSPA